MLVFERVKISGSDVAVGTDRLAIVHGERHQIHPFFEIRRGLARRDTLIGAITRISEAEFVNRENSLTNCAVCFGCCAIPESVAGAERLIRTSKLLSYCYAILSRERRFRRRHLKTFPFLGT